MEPNEVMEQLVGKTGLFSVKHSLDPFVYLRGGSLRYNTSLEAQRVMERISETLRQSLYKVVEDGRRYDFHPVGFKSWVEEMPPYSSWIMAEMAVGLVSPEDCQIGEYHLLRREYPAGEPWWSLWSNNEFRYEGNFLWRRVR